MNRFFITLALTLAPFAAFAEDVSKSADSSPVAVPADKAVPAKNTAEKKQTKIVLAAESCEASKPLPLFRAAFVDEGNLDGKKYSDDEILNEEIIDKEFSAGTSSATAVGEWIVPVKDVPAAQRNYFRVYRFRVASDIFAKAKIRVKSPQKAQIFIEDKFIANKLTAEDSFEKSGELLADLTLETRSYDIYVKTLAGENAKIPEGIRVEVETEKGIEKTGLRFLKNGEKRSLNLADFNEGRRIADSALSPNGKYLMAKYSSMQPDGSRLWDFEVRDLKTGKIVYAAAGTPAAWMPNGARLYWSAVSGERKSYYEYNLETQTRRVLAENLPNANCEYVWLPDESGFIVKRKEVYANPTDQWGRVENIADRRPGYRDRTYLYLYKFDGNVMTRITAGHHNCQLQSVSLDGKRILVATQDVDYSRPHYQKGNLYEINLETAETVKIIDGESYEFFCDYSPDGKKILILAGANFKNNLGSALPEGMLPNSFDQQLYVMDAATREIEAVSKSFDPSITSAQWGGDGRIYLLAEAGDRKHAFVYDLAQKKFEPIKVLNGEFDNIYKISLVERPRDFVPVIVAHGSNIDDTGKGIVLDLAGGNATVFYRQERPFSSFIEMGTTHDWNFVSKVSGSEGDTISGYYYLPPKFDANKKYPMIVYYYGGTSPTVRSFNAHYPFFLWASHGYVVYVVNPSGATGFGQEFAARHVNAWGKVTADEIIQGTKQFCDEHPFVDRKKIGCIGASYGGFMTMYLQTRSDIFAAAVSHAGISNISSYWGGGYWGVDYNAIAAAGSQPWSHRGVFVEQSPLFWADKINTPILFCHGQKDTNVPPLESHQMFAALRLLGKTTELITFKDEDHGIMDYKRRLQWGKSHMAWFDRFLKNDEDWWFELWPSDKKLLNN